MVDGLTAQQTLHRQHLLCSRGYPTHLPLYTVLIWQQRRQLALHKERVGRFTFFMFLKQLLFGAFIRDYVQRKGFYVLLSRTQARPSRAAKQQQEENSVGHVQAY